MKWHTIPLEEKVPKNYRRKFLWDSENIRQVIEVNGKIDPGAMRVGFEEKNAVPFSSSSEESLSLDWVEEVVCRIRFELSHPT